MATQVYAFMNCGRWLYYCPDCHTAIPVDKDICPVCFPDVVAKMFQEVSPKKFRLIPDRELREKARAQAAVSGKLHQPKFPSERAKIERVLRVRKRQNINWEPGESLDLLISDNIRHGDPVPELTNGL